MRHRHNLRTETILLTLTLTLFPTCGLGGSQTDRQKDTSAQAAGSVSSSSSGKEAEAGSVAAAEPGDDADGSQATFGPNARACRLLPIADLEAHFGAKVKITSGLEDGPNSTCGGEINGHGFHIQTAPAGTGGLPTTVPQGLQFARMMGSGMMKDSGMSIEDTKDFGDVGCYTGKVRAGLAGKQPVQTTSCFQISGGYLILTLGNEEADKVSYEVVKRFLEKAAARRKSS